VLSVKFTLLKNVHIFTSLWLVLSAEGSPA